MIALFAAGQVNGPPAPASSVNRWSNAMVSGGRPDRWRSTPARGRPWRPATADVAIDLAPAGTGGGIRPVPPMPAVPAARAGDEMLVRAADAARGPGVTVASDGTLAGRVPARLSSWHDPGGLAVALCPAGRPERQAAAGHLTDPTCVHSPARNGQVLHSHSPPTRRAG